VSFAVSGSQFKVSADRLTGDGFSQYGSIDKGVGDTDYHAVVVSVVDDNAELTNLCQSVSIPIPGPLQPILGSHKIIKITAGGGGGGGGGGGARVRPLQMKPTHPREQGSKREERRR